MLGIVPSLCSVTEITMWELVLSLLQVKERVGEVVLNLRPCSWKEGILILSSGDRLTAGVQPGPHYI